MIKKTFLYVLAVSFVFFTGEVNAVAKKSHKPAETQDVNLLYMKGRQHFLDGEYEKAATLLEQALKTNPENSFVSHQLAEVYLRLNEADKATSLAEKAVAQEPQNVEYLTTLGGVYATAKRYAEAKEQYRNIVELEPTNRKAPLLIGILEAESGDMDAGAKSLTAILEKNSEDVMAYFYRAKIYLEQDKMDKAKKDLAKCIELRPSFVEAGTALGLLQERLGEKEQAIETYKSIQGTGKFKKFLAQLYLQKNDFEKALEELLEYERSEPDDYTVRVKTALIFFELKKYKEAKDRFTTILKEQPEADNMRFYLGAVLEEMKQWDQAITTYKKVSSDSVFYKESVLHTGYIYRRLGKLEEGLKFAAAEVKKSPNVVEFYDMQAAFFEGKGKYSDALKILEVGLKKFPEDEKLLYFKAAVMDKLGDRDRSIALMEEILVKHPENAHVLNFVGYTLAEAGKDLDKAEKYISKALQLRPNDGFIEDSLGWILFKKGKIAEAEKHLMRAKELQPEEAVVYEHLGDLYVAQQKPVEALKAYQRAVDLSQKKDTQFAKKISEKLALMSSKSAEDKAH